MEVPSHTMGSRTVDPQSIRNVTLVGEPADTTRVVRRLLRRGATTVVHRGAGAHTIRVAELSSHAPVPRLERSLRVADGVIVVLDAAVPSTPRLETILRMADDHQVARLCLVTALDHPDADFGRCVHAIAATRGAQPLPLHLPLGRGPGFEGILDLVEMWAFETMAADFFGDRWPIAEQWYRDLVAAVSPDDGADSPAGAGSRRLPPELLRDHIRRVTRLGEGVPVLCDAARNGDDIAALLDAVVDYLPSPMLVCQPEHALDY